jgi:general secretion pathway protein D
MDSDDEQEETARYLVVLPWRCGSEQRMVRLSTCRISGPGKGPDTPTTRLMSSVICVVLVLVFGTLFFALTLTGEDSAYRAYQLQHKPASEVGRILIEAIPELADSSDFVVDERNKQLLVRGNSAIQQLATDLIRAADTPRIAGQPPKPRHELRVYEGPSAEIEGIGAQLRQQYGDQLRIGTLADEGRLIIAAPPLLHDAVRQRFTNLRQTGSKATPGTPADRSPEPRFLPIRPERLATTEARLRESLGERMTEVKSANQSESPVAEYLVQTANGQSVDLGVDYERSGLWMRGPEPLLEQLQQLARAVDRHSASDGRLVRVLPVQQSDPAKVRQAVEAYRRPSAPPVNRLLPPAAPRGRPRSNESGSNDGTPTSPVNSSSSKYGIALANHFFQVEGGQGAQTARDTDFPDDAFRDEPSPDNRFSDNGDATPQSRLRELATDVEIETLPDLNVIILRGRQQDVEELTRIIRELERISAETEPEIEVYLLEHTRGAAMAELIDEVNEDLTSGRKGRVSVLPLVKPNALLLIGWGDAVRSVKELIAKLDQPTSPKDQLKVFQLQHANATTLSTSVTQFFANRGGLGAELQVTPDIRTNSLIVHAAPRDLEEVELLIRRIDVPQPSSVRQARVFPLQNSLATEMTTTLRSTITAATGQPGLAGRKTAAVELMTVDAEGQRRLEAALLDEVEITADVRSNSLIVTGPGDALDVVALLIRQLDSPIGTAQIKIFRIVNGDAADLIEMLRALLPPPTITAAPIPLADGEASLVPLRFSLDSRTNSIIASGSSGDLEIVEALLLRLDEKDVQQRQNAVYRLKNSPSVAVAAAVNEFLRSERQVQLASPQMLNLFEQIESEVVVVPEPVSNTLIISATPRFYEEIMKLVEQLDAQPPQVVIQVLIGEVALNNIDEFGVEIGLQDSILFDRSLLGDLVTTTETVAASTPAGVITTTNQIIQAASNQPGFNFNNQPLGNSGSTRALNNSNRVGSQGLSSFSVGRLNNELGYGGLVLSASSESVSVLVRALQESRRMEILSRPQITTLDNQPAFIQVGQRVPRVTGSNVNQIGISNTVELENVGLILGVTPRISPEGMVVMEVDAEKSEVAPVADGIPISVAADGTPILSPRVDITTAQTTVSAADGETIILGGLITRGTQTTERRVPYLSDIPIAGRLFRFDSKSMRRTELLIILTPQVIRGQEDMERLKQIESARMSWCAADLHRLHGDTGMCHRENCPICDAGTLVVYPDMNPRGIPLESIPTP